MKSFGPQCPWYDHYERFGPPTLKYCEDRICAFINEPYNTWSNFSYLLVGLMIILSNKSRPMRMLGISIMSMGFCSFFYHATNNLLSQFGDYLGMFAFVCLLLTFNLQRAKRVFINFSFTYLSLALIFSLVFYLFYSFSIQVQAVIGLLGIIVLFTEFRLRDPRINYAPYFFAISFFVIGEICSILDATGILCFKSQPFFNGHCLWHLWGGLGTYFTYKFYKQLECSLSN